MEALAYSAKKELLAIRGLSEVKVDKLQKEGECDVMVSCDVLSHHSVQIDSDGLHVCFYHSGSEERDHSVDNGIE